MFQQVLEPHLDQLRRNRHGIQRADSDKLRYAFAVSVLRSTRQNPAEAEPCQPLPGVLKADLQRHLAIDKHVVSSSEQQVIRAGTLVLLDETTEARGSGGSGLFGVPAAILAAADEYDARIIVLGRPARAGPNVPWMRAVSHLLTGRPGHQA